MHENTTCENKIKQEQFLISLLGLHTLLAEACPLPSKTVVVVMVNHALRSEGPKLI